MIHGVDCHTVQSFYPQLCQTGYIEESINTVDKLDKNDEIKINLPGYPLDENSGHDIQEMLALLNTYLLAPYH